MPWPSPQDYSEAVQNPKEGFFEHELRAGRPELNQLGLPRPRSGSFATVYKILGTSRNWAVRCFLNPVSDQQERYNEISAHLKKINLPYLVQFDFFAQGIKVAAKPYPILKMEWVEGEPLISFIERSLGNSAALISLALRWVEMINALRNASVAHGDLQHGNILIVNSEFRLVDYDGMFVPSLSGKTSPERGQRNYQHPQRTEFDYGPGLDNFSSWVVYVSLIALSVRPELWHQFSGGDECLLFRQADFEHPERSGLFKALENSKDERIQSVVGLFRSLLDLRAQDVPPVDSNLAPLPRASVGPPSKRPSWLNDYVPAAPKEDTTAKATTPTSVSAPSPSWIQDFVNPVPVIEYQFTNSPRMERAVLGASVFLIALTIFLMVLGLAPVVALAVVLLLMSALNYGIWSFRFRRDPGVIAMKAVADELNASEEKLGIIRAVIQSWEADEKSLRERHAFEQKKIARELEVAKQDEQKELSVAEAAFQLQMNSISSRRRALTKQEAGALQNISNTLGVQLASLNRQISDLVHAEAAELSRTLAAQQDQYVKNYLRGWLIDGASIQGIGPGFTRRLRTAGILSAADVDNRVYGVKGFGATRSASLFAWQAPLTAKARQKIPQALSPSEKAAIEAKYSSKRQGLVLQKIITEKKIKDAEISVKAQYKSTQEPLDTEDLLAKGNAQLKKETIEHNYRERYRSIMTVRTNLDEGLKRSVAEIEDKSIKERRNLFALHWEQEKIRRRMAAFKGVRFPRYLRYVIGF